MTPAKIYIGRCAGPGCTRPVVAKGLCHAHLKQQYKGRELTPLIRSLPFRERFWKYVNKDGPTQPHMTTPCWVWVAQRNPQGYGRVRDPELNRVSLAHRVAWRLAHGADPNELFVCHHCDNPGCVRADHLFIGTNTDNMRDAKRKGRVAHGPTSGAQRHPEMLARGSRHGMVKLTVSQVREIRAAVSTQSALAERFGVSRTTIGKIRSRMAWVWLD